MPSLQSWNRLRSGESAIFACVRIARGTGVDVDESLNDAWRPGHSLPRRYYTDASVFEAEVRAFLARQWVAACHVSEVESGGDFVTFDAFGYSVIVLRQPGGGLAAFHNVCRHRGARICAAERGRASRLTCRYHGWSYRLDGSLAAWRHMPAGLEQQAHGLRRCGVAELCGIVYVSMEPERAPSFDALTSHVREHWRRYALHECKVAAKRVYTLAANWKLGVENNLECYHCLQAHPEYTSANAFVKADERVTPADVESFAAYSAGWSARIAARGQPRGRTPFTTVDGQLCRAGTYPLKAGFGTGTVDGEPAAPLLGNIAARDESVTTGCVGFLSYVGSMCDYAIQVTYVPKSVDATDVVLRWLVRADAREGDGYDLGRLLWLWDETTKQDKDLIELNASGIRSPAYVPGPYSELEWCTRDFVTRYMELMQG